MRRRAWTALAAIAVAGAIFAIPATTTLGNGADPQLAVIGTYDTGLGLGAAEIVAYEDNRMFVVNAVDNTIDIVSIANPAAPSLITRIDIDPFGGAVNSVDVKNGLVVAAVQANTKTNTGQAIFFDTSGVVRAQFPAGALPDMVTFTPDGKFVLLANEGEPNDEYDIDPAGTVTIIWAEPYRFARPVFRLPAPGLQCPGRTNAAFIRNVGFTDFNVGGPRHGELPAGVRIFGPGASVAQDLEPEYIAVSADSCTAYVTLQENNAMAIINIRTGAVISIVDLGKKDHSLPGNGLDPRDNDNSINIANWPVHGLYMPDSAATYAANGQTYIVTANEGDVREWGAFVENSRISSGSYVLDPTVFPNAAALKNNNMIGRLNASRYSGDTDGDGDFDEIHIFGGRSFSIWDSSGQLVFDSGDDFEQITAASYPDNFNSNNDVANKDSRSDDKGPEPEALAIGTVDGRTYAFVGLERIGGVMVYDISDPLVPIFIQYLNNRDFNEPAAPDSGPEGIKFIPAAQSPLGVPMILVANETSGTVTAYSFD